MSKKVNIFNKGKRSFTVKAAVLNAKGKEVEPAVILAPGDTVAVDATMASKLKKIYSKEITSPDAGYTVVDHSKELAELKAENAVLTTKVEALEQELAEATAPKVDTPPPAPKPAK